MQTYVEVHGTRGTERFVLETERVTLGSAPANDITLSHDKQVSRMHAALELLAAGWVIRDLASRNGTLVNGERVWADTPLRTGDEIVVGETRIVMHANGATDDLTTTRAAARAPNLTRREREVLIALCSAFTQDVFNSPATITEVADALVVTQAAVKQHLTRLYAKFEIVERGERARVRLANEAVRRGAISFAELRDHAMETA